MTVLEFEKWVSEHYDELKAAAERVTAHDERAQEILHDVLESVLAGDNELPANLRSPIGYLMVGVKLCRRTWNQHNASQAALLDRFAESVNALGTPDTFLDTERLLRAQKARRAKLRKKANRAGKSTSRSSLISEGVGVAFEGRLEGTARWRFQTLRDDRLFIKRAIRSQAESIWAAVKRQAHGLERGNSYTEFGLEASK